MIEEKIVEAVKKMLCGRVNDVLEEAERAVPMLEFSRSLPGGYLVTHVTQRCHWLPC
jgi:hypothetical protein